MKNVLAVLLALLLFSLSLNIYLFVKLDGVKNVDTKTLTEDYFDKKKDCSKLSAQIKNEIEKPPEGAIGELFGTDVFEMMFYSPKENSCLYATERINTGKREYFIFNALTGHRITSFQFPSQFQDYKNFLFEYSKGEIRL